MPHTTVTTTEAVGRDLPKRRLPREIFRRWDWKAIAEDLSQHWNEWRKVDTGVPISTVNALRAGKMLAIRPVQDFRFSVRDTEVNEQGTRTGTLFMKYVGQWQDEAR